ncbi:OLC1v1021003C1 [Oldenlandia corymbosa var. corymbosa]|uniref:OLC1v1021003C1 n=1 Tax=Oldenlandia corymbosa var. corymbosa TaxID=529605 RepID=A0AAV1BX50_OLDCO|nr:OLC1v1021003C1 [Oldenlandia corymbosa var. corymbosa]
MQRANYFAYVMLIHMGPPDLFGGGNVTFLMPNDKTLAASNDSISSGVVSDFLQRHSIPSALMFEDMEHIPSGSILPTSKPGLILRVNHKGSGRRSLYLNNVRIISPNICSSQGASIRCHGIDGVIQPEFLPTDQDGGGTTTPPPDQCSNQNDNDNNSTKSRPTPPPAAAASPPPESHNNSESAPPAGTASGAACSGYDRHQLVILLLPLACCCFFFFWV